MIGFGPRSALGLFLTPMSSEQRLGPRRVRARPRDPDAAVGRGAAFRGAIADRFGPLLVLIGGAVLYAIGLAWMAYAATPASCICRRGLLIGFGLAGCSFTLVIGAFGKLLPPEWRSLAFGLGTAAGSFGQFLFSPLAVALIDAFGWQTTLLIFAAIVLLIMPLSLALATPRERRRPAQRAAQQSVKQALREAFGHRSYVLLVLGFFTCGFQVFFITVHLPAYLVDRGLSADIGAWTHRRHRAVQHHRLVSAPAGSATACPSAICSPSSISLRSVAILAFHHAAGDARHWRSCSAPSSDCSGCRPCRRPSALVAVMFGTRWLTMLFGFAFFSHQVGGFLGVWLGGVAVRAHRLLRRVWWLSIAARRALGADQPADRREAGRAAGRRGRLTVTSRPAWLIRPTCAQSNASGSDVRGDIQGDRDREGRSRPDGRAQGFRREAI